MDACIAEAGAGAGQKRFPKADVVVDLYSSAVNQQKPLVDVVAERTPQFLSHEEALIKVCRRFIERKRQLNVMDFDDLLLNWKALLVEHPAVAARQQERFKSVLVDEYQDVNKLQADLVDLCAAKHRNVMVVGDDAQSIYSFRGADVESILRFPERYPDASVRRLTLNYRSTPQVLALANASIAVNKRQFPKELRPVRTDRERPAFVSVTDVQQQAEFVAQRLLELRDEGTPLKEIAVLYRAHHHAMELQLELGRRGIPFVVRSGVRFFEQAHVKDVLAFLRWVDNPRDELAFKRFFKLFPGLGAQGADSVWDVLAVAAEQGQDPRVVFTRGLGLDDHVAARGRSGLSRCRRLVTELCTPAMIDAPAAAIDRILDEGAYREYLRSRYTNAQNREDDLAQLAAWAIQFPNLSEFVAELALAGEIQGEDVEDGEELDEKVVLSSIHQAKGLEWQAVFVLWVAEGRFPTPQSLKTTAGEEEERRLFYVAATRAKDDLYLVHPIFSVERDQTRVILRPSRFIAEIDPQLETLVERWAIETTAAPASTPLPAAPAAALPAGDTPKPPDLGPLFGRK